LSESDTGFTKGCFQKMGGLKSPIGKRTGIWRGCFLKAQHKKKEQLNGMFNSRGQREGGKWFW